MDLMKPSASNTILPFVAINWLSSSKTDPPTAEDLSPVARSNVAGPELLGVNVSPVVRFASRPSPYQGPQDSNLQPPARLTAILVDIVFPELGWMVLAAEELVERRHERLCLDVVRLSFDYAVGGVGENVCEGSRAVLEPGWALSPDHDQ